MIIKVYILSLFSLEMDTDIKIKAKFFFENRIKIHITTFLKSWYNGIIVEYHPTMIVIEDKILGLTPVSFSEIKNISIYKNHGRNNSS